MKSILASQSYPVLEQFVWSNVLLAFDFDGTLAPIVSEPARAEMRPRTRELLAKVAALYRVVVISGRPRSDVRRRLRGSGVLEVVGNHGIEPLHTTSRYLAEVQRWRRRFERSLAPLKGVWIEDKAFSLAVHYRKSREKKKARAAILRTVAELRDARVIGGKQVVNVLPRDAPHKGVALERERDRWGCDTAVYVGDDDTDEDVFALDQPGRLLAIRVGPKRASAAHYYIANQRAIDALLRAFIDLRRAIAQRSRAVR